MAFPVVAATAESSVNTAGTSHAVTMPAGITGDPGEIVVVLLDHGSGVASFNALAGWTELVDENLGNGITAWVRDTDGTEGATVTFTSSANTRSAHNSYRITGAEDPATQLPQLSTVATGSSTAPNATTCTPTGGAKDYLWITFFGRAGEEADDDTWVTSAPASYGTLLQKACGVAGTNLGGMMASAHRTNNAASEDAGAFTIATGAWRAYTLAVHPTSSVSVAPGPIATAATLPAPEVSVAAAPPAIATVAALPAPEVSVAVAPAVLAAAVAVPQATADGGGEVTPPSRTNVLGGRSAAGFGTGSFTTGSFTPPDNSLLVVAAGVLESAGSTDPSGDMTITDSAGLTWTSRVTAGGATSWSKGGRIWTAPVATGASMTVTLDCGARNSHRYVFSIVAYTSYDTGTPVGATGSGVAGDPAPQGSWSWSLSAAPPATSEVFAAIFLDTGTATTPGTGWTEVHDVQGADDLGIESQARGDSTSATVAWDDTDSFNGLFPDVVGAAVEVRGAPGGGAGDATATPGVVAGTAALPAPAVGVGAAPAVVAGAVAVGDVDVSVGAAPAAAAVAAGLPAPAVSVGAAPAVLARAATLPQATPDVGGGNATASPDPVASAGALPAPAVSVGAAPAAAAVAAALPSPAVSVAAAPNRIITAATLPQAVAAVAAAPGPAAVAAALAQVAVAVGVAPAVVATVATLPQATPDVSGGAGATASPEAIATLATLPQVTVSAGALPAVLATLAALPPATPAIGFTVTPAALAVLAALPQARVSVAAAPAPVAVVALLPPVDHAGGESAVLLISQARWVPGTVSDPPPPSGAGGQIG